MKWEDLKQQAAAILENKPHGDFEDITFSTRSGPFNVMSGLPIVHKGYSDEYKTVANGSTCAKHVTVRCRKADVKDADGRPIYEQENGRLFVFVRRPGDAWSFGSAKICEPNTNYLGVK
ncbi:MAG: hypothetical protein IBX50_12445 [Marinospirillum sp.]|uniref:hypothetical protein n=1 Tax=Marinospirillum sp. TaxID=2183934 RepID=UPI0019E748CE|nr:hypothetical protein [Marinospirillum sp.]MBE0507506.1 hypothetical protein [Marinospirillum sp.]